jgi:polysaccharide export outer membrane protein
MAKVEVKVKEYQSQFVTVVGEVNQPGRRPLRGRTRLFDVLLESAGFTPRASGEVTVTRRQGAFEGGQQMLRLRFGSANPSPADLLNLEIPLVSGDLVAALPKRYITVEGEVQRPARYPLELDFTLSQAVLGAGGLTRYGKNEIRIRRTDPVSGSVAFVEVDLKEIREGRTKDPVLLPDDVVLVGRRTF